MNSPKKTIPNDLFNVLRGFLMGGADVVPGVSGGTVALVVGIYERLVTAISRFDTTFLSHVKSKRWAAAIEYIDLRFLVALGVGILSGAVALGGLMEGLLSGAQSRPLTLAAFFGMILASSVVVFKLIRAPRTSDRIQVLLLGIAGAAFAFWLTGLEGGSGDLSLGYVFLCGVIGICAMILPGISGAYLLLILGLYTHITELLHRLPHGDINASDIGVLFAFTSGCAVGIISFSKVLRWLLASFQSGTMAVLCGFMIGALRKVWPFQHDLTPTVEKLKHKQFESYIPDMTEPNLLLCITFAVGSLAAILIVDFVANGSRRSKSISSEAEERTVEHA